VELPILATLAHRATDLLVLVTDLPVTPPALVEEGRRLMGDLEERLPPPRQHTGALATAAIDLPAELLTRVSGFLDVLSGAPDVSPDVRDDAAQCAEQLWDALDAARAGQADQANQAEQGAAS